MLCFKIFMHCLLAHTYDIFIIHLYFHIFPLTSLLFHLSSAFISLFSIWCWHCQVRKFLYTFDGSQPFDWKKFFLFFPDCKHHVDLSAAFTHELQTFFFCKECEMLEKNFNTSWIFEVMEFVSCWLWKKLNCKK